MTDQELKDLVGSLATAQKETDRQLKETDRQLKETDRQLKETDQQLKKGFEEMRKSDEKMRKSTANLNKQMGELGNKFGSFTEGMAYPSMQKVLEERFHMECIAPNVKRKKEGDTLELDILAYANTTVNQVYIVEVKSNLKEPHLDQILKILERFRVFFPEHADKQVYGILAAVEIHERERRQVAKAGIYLALIQDEIFGLTLPEDFQARVF